MRIGSAIRNEIGPMQVSVRSSGMRPEAKTERWTPSATTLNTLLGAEPVDLDVVSRVLGHAVTDVHVALVAVPLDDDAPTRRELHRVLESADVPALVTPGEADEWWAWLSSPSPPPSRTIERLAAVRVQGVLIGIGEPERGRDGFRRSHSQALTALRVAALPHHPEPTVVRHHDVEIAASLCSDPERARRMAAERLGLLAGADDTATRLRATLRTLLRNGLNRAQTARMLDVHHKTVTYRVTQAEEALGRPISHDTLDLEVALAVDEALGGL